jgi:peptidyl-prolyl cis-trans isomerase-like 4
MNSSTSQEVASASEELSSHAEIMKQEVLRFKVKGYDYKDNKYKDSEFKGNKLKDIEFKGNKFKDNKFKGNKFKGNKFKDNKFKDNKFKDNEFKDNEFIGNKFKDNSQMDNMKSGSNSKKHKFAEIKKVVEDMTGKESKKQIVQNKDTENFFENDFDKF